ncbi:protein FAM169B-like isoform X4 [Saccopteryx leptura]|uniref:protein FAM169B-like isoform X4 n=1 Tax=Saccopteryx leptura TaxID=249018 RepID=UPI00339C288F
MKTTVTCPSVVAVYLKESWWSPEDVLRTSDPAREGLMQVRSFGERIVLFILNVVIFGSRERTLDNSDLFFLPHSAREEATLLWRDGAAVGFYTTKRKGSLCGDGTGACYLLPVLDTVFVRRRHRRQGLGVAMLRDFCETFRDEEALGISWPISPAMYQVCRKFLSARPEERERLWEVEPPGAWGQRASIWLQVQLQPLGLPDLRGGEAERQTPACAQPGSTRHAHQGVMFCPFGVLLHCNQSHSSTWGRGHRAILSARANSAPMEPRLRERKRETERKEKGKGGEADGCFSCVP